MSSVHEQSADRDPDTIVRPGWLELGVAIVVAVVLYLAAGLITVLLPEDFPVSLGHINFLISGLVPLLAFLAAVAVRLRAFAPFGFRRVDLRWLLLGAGVGFACFLLSWPVSAVFDPFFPGSEGVQQGYRDAASAGALSLIVAVALGGLLTPFGEEVLFRGVLANFLFRWGPWVGVLVSAAIFAVAHGINSVMPLAFVIGLATGLLLRFSDSIWPGILVHVVYNSAGIIYHGVAGS
ncbi:CPBP family intramembrane glutamic endopeptidase [Millisia brevis]|uniref:CPBP family intramembrane glutamic endopeptidase n=1 Tax=Millisia brevis TaxID=264148 RepID=UPI00082A52B0|nr:type II CAAX endopeptidase family protein [Millisia brevis]